MLSEIFPEVKNKLIKLDNQPGDCKSWIILHGYKWDNRMNAMLNSNYYRRRRTQLRNSLDYCLKR